jgi:hypothetical protein
MPVRYESGMCDSKVEDSGKKPESRQRMKHGGKKIRNG